MSSYIDVKGRIDIFVDEDLERVRRWVPGVAESYLVTEETHDGANRHVHLYLRTQYDMKKLRNRFTYMFSTHKGNKAYSFGEMWEGEDAQRGYFRYMCKGDSKDVDPKVVMYAGLIFNQETINTLHQEYYQHPSKLKRKRKEENTIEEELLEHCKKHQYRPHNKLAICQALLKIYRDRKKGWTDYEIERKMNCVLAQLDDDDSFINEQAERFCRKLDR